MANYIHYRKIGVTSGTITGTLSDANGPVALTGWTNLKIVALHPDTETEKFNHAITPDGNQVTNPGVFSYQPISTDVDTRGEFKLFFRGTDPAARVREFPIDDPDGTKAFGSWIVY
jgi:hypothetical protein